MATEELVCNTLMSIPSEQEAMNVLAEMDIKEKRSLLRALKDFIERIKNYLKKHGLIETKAFTDDFEAINKLANMVNESIVRERSALETSKHSFAGINSLNKNQTLLEKAIQMESDGFSLEDIRQQTGWFKSYDGKWRYEIDDSQSILIEKPALTKHTDEDGETYFTGKLSDILNHNNLYEAYPQLRDINIIIQTTNVGTSGIYSAKSNYITLNLELFKRHTKEYSAYLNGNRKAEIERIEQTPEYKEYSKWHEDDELMESMDPVVWLKEEEKARKKFFDSELGKRYYQLQWGKYNGQMLEFGWSKGAKSVLMHEIQHAIQYIEGFTSGSSPEYWYKKKLNQYRDNFTKARTEFLKLYDNASEELKNALDVLQETHNRLNVSDSVMNSAYDKAASLIFDDKKHDALWDYAETAQKLNDFYKSKSTGDSEYRRTAGEIEANDVSNRLNLTETQRKVNRPDIDRKNVVFADASGVSNSITEPFVDNNGTRFENAVLLDTDFFDGMSPRNWGKKLRQYVFNRSQNKPFILPVLDESSNVQILQFAKKNDRVRKNGSNTHLVLNELVNTTDNLSKLAVIHINEIIAVSEESNPYYSNDNSHGWMDKNGWLHRTANIINIKNGNIYEITIDIPKTNDGRALLYATKGKIKKVGQTDVKSLKIKASRSHSNFDNIISDKNKNNNTDFKKNIRYSLTEPGEITDADLLDVFDDSEEAFDYDFTGSNLDFSQETKEAIQNTNKILADMNKLTKGKKISVKNQNT